MSTNEPREFWLLENRCSGALKAYFSKEEIWKEMLPNEDEIRVIEYSAVKALQDRIAELENWKREMLAVMKPVFDFEHPEIKLGESKVSVLLEFAKERDQLKAKLEQIRSKQRCPCGGIILADSEDWPIPVCDSCYTESLDIDKLRAENARLKNQAAKLVEALDEISSTKSCSNCDDCAACGNGGVSCQARYASEALKEYREGEK